MTFTYYFNLVVHIAEQIINPFVMARRRRRTVVILNFILNIFYIVGIFYVYFKQVIFIKLQI